MHLRSFVFVSVFGGKVREKVVYERQPPASSAKSAIDWSRGHTVTVLQSRALLAHNVHTGTQLSARKFRGAQ